MFRLASCLAAVALVGVNQVSASTVMPIPTHYYPLDIDARDDAGTNEGTLTKGDTGTNGGTLTNGASIVLDSERGYVLDLDGVNDYVSLQFSNIPPGPTNTSVFTIAAWVKTEDIVGTIYCENNDSKFIKNHFVVVTGKIQFDQYPPRSGGIRSLQIDIDDGSWHHVAYVQNEPASFQRQIYVDGTLETFDNSLETYNGSAPTLWNIGGPYGKTDPRFLEGRIDELRFYNVALDADQIGTLASEPTFTPEPTTFVLFLLGALGLLIYSRRIALKPGLLNDLGFSVNLLRARASNQ